MRYRTRYALLGGILGLGSPIGSLLWRALIHTQDRTLSQFLWEWRQSSYFYSYMTFGTVIAFSLFGYVLGRRDEDLTDLSITDGLTGVFNHRYLHEQLALEIERSDRYALPLTCIMLDIDDFKQVNDRHGHPFGDIVLTTTAKLIRDSVRQTDVVGRYGGEEFLVIMPHTSEEAALPLAERVIKTIREYPFAAEDEVVHITVSIGLATYPFPDHGIKTKSSLLSAADQALYKAKRMGKNKAMIWEP